MEWTLLATGVLALWMLLMLPLAVACGRAFAAADEAPEVPRETVG